MIILHQFQISPFCDKVRRILHWKGLDYEVREVPLLQAMGVRKINPAGKLPCLEHDGRLVADSSDIALYLEEKFPQPPLLPENPDQRALCYVLEDWADESLYFYEMYLRFTQPHNAARWIPALTHADPGFMRPLAGVFIPRAMKRATRAQGVGRKSKSQVLLDVERHLGAVGDLLGQRSWLVGDALSLADLSVFAQLACIRGTREGERLIDARPDVASWMQRVDMVTSTPDS